jgi:hypothetical protein
LPFAYPVGITGTEVAPKATSSFLFFYLFDAMMNDHNEITTVDSLLCTLYVLLYQTGQVVIEQARRPGDFLQAKPRLPTRQRRQ